MLPTSITRNTPINATNVYQLLLEFVQRLSELQEDPDALKKMAEASYALPEAEMARAEEAQRSIATNQAIVEDIQKRQSLLDASAKKMAQDQSDLDKKISELKSLSSQLDSNRALLENQKASLATKEKDVELLARDVQEKLKALDDRDHELDDRESKMKAYEKKLKDRVAKLKEQTEGL